MHKVMWNFHTIHAAGTGAPPFEEGYQWPFNDIKKATEGQFEAIIHEGSSLGFATHELWDVVGKGLVPIAEIYPAHVSAKYPWAQVLELPFLYDVNNIDLIDYLWDNLWDDFARLLAKDNLMLLAASSEPFGRGFSVNKTLDPDPKAILKGMKIRVCGPISGWATETLGGTPVPITANWAEVFKAVKTGTVDGLDAPIFTFNVFGMKFHEVIKYALIIDKKSLMQLQTGSTSWMVVANKDMFESLPVEVQGIIKGRFKKAGKRWIRKLDFMTPIQLATKKYGMEVQMVNPETVNCLIDKAPDFWEIWRKEAGTLGNELLDRALELIKNYKK